MQSEIPDPIKLTAIDYDHLEDCDDIPEAIAFRVGLSAEPSDIWRAEFEAAYHGMYHPIKPMVEIGDKWLWIAYLPRYEDIMQEYFDFLGSVVARASAEEARTIEIHRREGRDQPKLRFRDRLRDVRLPA